jgi:heavy metal response regulator
MRVLVVEDDPGVASFVKKGLTEASCVVDVAANGHDGLRLGCAQPYDVMILDVMLPGRDGFSILRELRERDVRTPVICLTARDTVDDRVTGLDLGADDYLVKPFSFAELFARIHAVLRRSEGLAAKPIIMGDMTIDLLRRSVSRAGKRLDLTPREFAMVEYLGRNAGRVLTRTMILEHVWDMHQDPMTNVVDVHINRLRRKIDQGFEKPLLHTIRGVGYVLREET